ncbi:related to PEX5-peroxisomal targeting signal receptor [Serendipita indica DSM 11827]|uniref:Related to PEX5-peroxisomal targeting signal receptor n=1 Tax=Serendipita indica (strain DSM 11827) TaxID=1109443 RepID=G4TNW6_SERID|nr:related to PEX5-peroxisomal targeting signal receptor [Serendipita indica DSM 11827]
MSFSTLISGAECATSSNPLSQVLKHTDVDNSLQRDRIGVPGGSSLQHLPRTAIPAVNQADMVAARQFFQHNGPIPQGGPMIHMPPTLSTPPLLSPASGSATPEVLAGLPAPSRWAADLEKFKSGSIQAPMTNQMIQPVHAEMPAYMHHMPMAGYQPLMPPMALMPQVKGKGKAVDQELDAAFQELALQSKSGTTGEANDLDQVMDRLLKEQEAKAQEQQTLSDFQRVWRDINAQPSNETLEEMAKWEKEFNEAMAAEREEFDQTFEPQMNASLAGIDRDFGLATESFKVDGDGMPVLGLYPFDEKNEHARDSKSSLQAAKDLLNAGGSLSEVALMLEAAIQNKDLGEGGYEAWILLGEVRSMDEREELGMLALREGVRIASENGGAGGVGMLSLAISYTNEGYDRPSQLLLLNWLKTRYPEHAAGVNLPSTFTEPWAVHDVVQEAFLSVARAQQHAPEPDPELQVGLGVLLYINGEFSKAADCFGAALSMRPEDYVLWNRYGSCLSNGNKPEESLAAYREALRLRPQYTRAMYNVGVACLNLGALKEAAEHFLSGLALQGDEGSSGPTKRSEQLWATLRRTLIAMDRADLADKARDGNLQLFKAEGFEF